MAITPNPRSAIHSSLPTSLVFSSLTPHTQGGSVSHRVFHTRLLPNLLIRTPEGLPELFHADVREACERMGGENGKLLLDTSTSFTQAQAAS
jgi:hypothetical protein